MVDQPAMIDRELFKLYEDPEGAEAITWSRRRFLGSGTLIGLESLLGSAIPFARFMPAGLIPVALADAEPGSVIAGKPGLRILNDRPLNAETPAHLLDDDVTPASRLFVRNNGVPPTTTSPADWTLSVSGESCGTPQSFSIAELKQKFPKHTYRLQLECGGNGRAEFRPRVPGNQWTTGAIGCPEWTGVRLRDVLQACGIKPDAVYVAFNSADGHLSGDPDKVVISRGVPLGKALEDESLIAFAMNGDDIPAIHGAPLRMVCGGWPGSVSGKWLTDLLIRDQVHDGAKMTGSSYRVPCRAVAPGERVADEDLCIIESMPVKSLISYPQSGITMTTGKLFEVRGHAWAGDLEVSAVEVSLDFGASWQSAKLASPPNRLAWQRWQTRLALPAVGYYEVWVRATDSAGRSQPMLVPGWNPKGYLNNATHRIAVRAV
jgi:DMSO/TMAO reductase YedYZ molybdopterin-dependent catalytic subunit